MKTTEIIKPVPIWKQKLVSRLMRIFYGGTRNIRVYKCEKCGYEGKDTNITYTPNTRRCCPKCGNTVVRAYSEKRAG